MKQRLRTLRVVIVLGLAAGAVTAGHLAASPGIGPASADTATGTAGLFVPTQGSVLDTRTGIGGVSGPVAANTWYPVQVAGQAGVPTTGVSSVQVSVTVLTPAATGLVKVAANGTAVVPIAALTYTGGGGSISASSIVALPADGKIRVLAQTSVTLLVHMQGYYTAGNGSPAPGGYVPVNPARLVDTRNGTGLPQAKLATGSTTSVKVGGLHNVPADASAVFLMLTGISTSSTAGYFSPYPTGTTRPGNVSLNYLANTATILGAAVDLGTGGQFDLWIGPAGTAIDVVVDVIGYYTATAGTGGAFTPAAARVYDSRLSPNVALPARSSRVVQVGGIAGVPSPTDRLSAYAFSAQIVHSGSNAGSLAMGPGDLPSAVVAAVYFSASSNVRSSLVIVPPADDGSVLLVNSSLDPIHVILDVEGWFSDIGPAVPFVSSAEYEEGGWAAASTGPGTFLLEPAEGPVPAAYRYSLDGAPVATVAGPTGQLTLSPQGSGEHVLTVSAIDAAGTASDTYDYSFNIGSPPASPAAVTVVATTGVASITWTPGTDNGAPINSYHLTLRDETTGTVYDEGSCGTCTQYVITSLDPTHSYTASVAADSGAGEGPFQVSAPFTPDTGTPGDCPDDSGCVIKPVDTPAMTSMDNPGGGVFPQLEADPDDYYTSTTEEVSDDSDPDAVPTNAIWSGYYLPNGYKRYDYVYDTIKIGHSIWRCNRTRCDRIGQVYLWVHEYINGGRSVMWNDQIKSDYVFGPRYYVEAEYQCARNISGREDRFCNTYSDKANGYDAEIVTHGVGRSDHEFDWWHNFGTARSVTKYQLLRLMVKWPDQNVVSRGGDGGYGTKLRMFDVRRDSSGRSKLAKESGMGF